MYLDKDAWLPVIRADDSRDIIAPWQIAERENPVCEIDAPRPDFQGALYQFMIGLLQTAFAPKDEDEWLEYWHEPPHPEELKKQFEILTPAFHLDNADGPAFMQDYQLGEAEKKAISALLIDAPGEKTIKDNLDHFIKRDSIQRLCPSCAAAALFTLQINAPSGGVGHRVGLRGGGPLTTLVRSVENRTLWQNLWMNVMGQERFPGSPNLPNADVFPWLGPTRVSDKKGSDTTPEDVHALQMYWSMPRRIRIFFTSGGEETCDLCGKVCKLWASEFRARNYGVNYTGAWVHPLAPYAFDKKKEKPPLSLKGQQGGLGYRHWLGLTISDPFNDQRAAQIIQLFMENRARDIGEPLIARLWCFGYDMDNMKARCWYDHTMPLFALNAQQRRNMLAWAGELINAARDITKLLRQQVKAAWFDRPEDAKGDMNTVVSEFWQQSESDFYRLLSQFAGLSAEVRQAPPGIYGQWHKKMWQLSLKLFDEWSLEGPPEDLDMKRVIAAREKLRREIAGSKSMKTLSDRAKPE